MGLFLSAKEKILNNSGTKILPRKNVDKTATPEPTPKTTPERLINITKNNEKINKKKKYLKNIWGFRMSHFFAKCLYKANEANNEQYVNQINDALMGLGNVVNKKIIPENKKILIKKSILAKINL